MSNEVAIRVEGLGKAYRIGLKEQQHETMLGALAAWVKSPLKNFREVRSLSSFGDLKADHRPQTTDHGPGEQKSVVSGQLSVVPSEPQLSGFIPQPSDIIWALKDVSFEVKHGEAVGIIGRNGAGKSTLLKILSRITEPTRGRATVYGRVASLLEVGTGFHPDLTGRENVYLNGTILGMKKREIDAKFDEIVEFSGVEKFIDTPVKRYSSGMRVRLAFAVAAHLEPEILIVDEVLAVGDAEFQKKCLGKMGEVSRNGRTVLFVSHNMAAVANLCSVCLILDRGSPSFKGAPPEAIERYLLPSEGNEMRDAQGLWSRPAWAEPYIKSTALLDRFGRPIASIALGGGLVVELDFECPPNKSLRRPVMGVVVNHPMHGALGGINMRMTGGDNQSGAFPRGKIKCLFTRLPFLQGRYTLDVWLSDGEQSIDVLYGAHAFSIEPTDIYGSGKLPYSDMGVALLEADWELQANSRLPDTAQEHA